MHIEQKEWCEQIRKQFPDYFTFVNVLEVGSLDVNGNNRYLFEYDFYLGVDVVKGKGVDIVSPFHLLIDYDLSCMKFDVVLSTNSFEHDMYWFLSLPRMIEVLKSKGLMFFCCSHSHRTHGTKKHTPKNSGTSSIDNSWGNYYRNLKVMDVYSVLRPEQNFQSFSIGVNGKDLTFWGIKR